MKSPVLLLALLLTGLGGASIQAQESIRPIVAAEFGKPVTIRAEFVPKPSDYYSQNLVKERFALKVLTVGDRALPEPVVIEYKVEAKGRRPAFERTGVVTTLEAYETLYQPPKVASPWLPKGEQGMGFALIHVLHVRLPPKQG